MPIMSDVKVGDWIEIYVADNGIHMVGADNSNYGTELVKVLALTPSGVYYGFNPGGKIAKQYNSDIAVIKHLVSNPDDLKNFKYYRECGKHCYYKPAKAPHVPNEFWGMVKADLNQAAYRSGATQLSKATKAGLIALMQKNGSANIEAAAKLLDSELGEAFISVILGYTLTYAPNISEDERVKKLAKEFRTGGMSTTFNVAFEAIMTTVAPALKDALNLIPAEEPEAKPALG